MSDPRTFDHALSWLRSGEISPDASLPADPERDRRARELRWAFQKFPGALETILAMSLYRAPVDHRLTGAEYRQHAQLRQGQNQLAAGILAYLDHAEALERKDHDDRSRRDDDGDHDDGGSRGYDGFSDASLTDPGIAVR